MEIRSDSTSAPSRRSGAPPVLIARGADPLALLARLTPRDRYLLEMLDAHQVLTTSQLTRLAFPSRAIAQRRLLTLYQLGVLERFRWYQMVGSQDWHYTLGLAGGALRAAARAVEPPRAAQWRHRLARLATSPRLGHLLGINEFFTCLAATARTRPGSALGAWWSERRCAERYGQLVRPDGYGRWSKDGRGVEFFFEYDTGSEPLTRVTAKLPGYADLAAAGGPTIPVLIWLPSPRREANLRAALATQPAPVAVATANTELARAVGQGPAGAVWLGDGQPHRCSLAELGPLAGADYYRPAAAHTGRSAAEAW